MRYLKSKLKWDVKIFFLSVKCGTRTLQHKKDEGFEPITFCHNNYFLIQLYQLQIEI